MTSMGERLRVQLVVGAVYGWVGVFLCVHFAGGGGGCVKITKAIGGLCNF